MSEVWRDIEGFDGIYQVSNQGRVKSLARTCNTKGGSKRTVKDRFLKPSDDGRGYLRVALYAGGKRKRFKVHRLVCQAFHENPGNKPQVNHINEDKTDNRACNLEWCTRTENCNHGTRNTRTAKALSKPVGQYTLDGDLVGVWQSANEVERQTGFSRGNISLAANGKIKQAYGFIWKYV